MHLSKENLENFCYILGTEQGLRQEKNNAVSNSQVPIVGHQILELSQKLMKRFRMNSCRVDLNLSV
jgi:hypothetical protein